MHQGPLVFIDLLSTVPLGLIPPTPQPLPILAQALPSTADPLSHLSYKARHGHRSSRNCAAAKPTLITTTI